MSDDSFIWHEEPLVARNVFKERARHEAPLPTFEAARELLPVPVLPEHPGWVAMYWRAWQMVWQHLRLPRAEAGFISPFIDPAFNNNIYMWDAAFMTQFALYARRALCPMGGLDNLYAYQQRDGFIPREIGMENGRLLFHPFDPNATGPNIMAWVEWRTFRHTGDEARLAQVFWPLLAFHRWCRSNRTWPSGLYWATGISSAMDNQPRVPDSNTHHRHWSWVDTSMQAVINCYVLEQMALLLDEEKLMLTLNQERVRLAGLINDQMWSEESSFYFDIDPNGRFSPIKSIAAYWGLSQKETVPEARRTPFIQHLRDSWSFNLAHRIPTQAADSEGYNAQTGNYWRGAVWPSTNYMVLKGLRHHGYTKLAYQIAHNHMSNVYEVFQETETFWENYAPETAVPGSPAKPDFTGASALTPISILLEDIIAINVDWPLRRVYWDRRLESTAAYGVRNYPLGADGTMTLLGNAEKVTITTTVPLTLEIRDAVMNVQTAVAAGTTEISLE